VTAKPSAVPDARLRELHGLGRTVAEIAAAVGLSRDRVYARLRALELAPHRPVRPPARVTLSVRLSPSTAAALRQRAQDAGLSVSAMVEGWVNGRESGEGG